MFSTQKWVAMDIVNGLVLCAFCRARPHASPSDYYYAILSQTLPLGLHLEHCSSVNRTHLNGRGHTYFVKSFNVNTS